VPNRKALAKQARLDERAQQIQLQQERERRTRNIIIATFAALIVVGSATLSGAATNWWGIANPKTSTSTSGKDTSHAVADEGYGHVADGTLVRYKHSPPSSGQHYATPAAWGPSQTVIPPETYVHNLEHGGIVLVYTCSSTECADIFSAARLLYQSLPQHPEPFHASPGVQTIQEVKFLSTQYTQGSLPKKYAVLAWDREEDLDSLDSGAITTFYNKYSEHGREDLP